MEEKILSKIEEIKEDMLDAIIQMVKIDSVETPAEPGAPYGKGVKKALLKALEISEKLGFRTVNLDNQIGYAEFGPVGEGESENYVCAIGHVDVVPTGDGWKQPPFSGYTENGVIYSRGVLDNKGPIMACLFGIYALKELGYCPVRPIRIIFGCDEESGFEDLTYYLSKEPAPAYGFTPDCKYPVVYAERGRAVIRVSGNRQELEPFFAFVTQYFISAKNNGDRLGIDFKHPEYGVMEMRNYKLATTAQGTPYFEAAFSYPAGHKVEEILEKIKEKAGDLSVSLIHNYDPVIFEKDSPMVKALQAAYEKVTGLDGTPVTTTGGTYAKAMPGIVPFGPSFPGQKGIGHNPNEWMSVEDLVSNAKIYGLGLYKLGLLNV